MIHKPKYEEMDSNEPFFQRFFTNHNLNMFMAGFVIGMVLTLVFLINLGLI